jgi:hypothetical protein
MKNHIRGIGAIVRKDVLLLWPMALLAVLLMLLYVVLVELRPVSVPPILLSLMATVSYVVIALVLASAIQEDAAASMRQDWLTRAVSRADLVVAKAVFVVVLGLVPLMIGKGIVAWRDGGSWVEILLYATTVEFAMITMVLALCAVAVLTSSLLQATAVVVAVIVAAMLLVPITLSISRVGEEAFGSGSGWLLMYPRAWFAVIAAAVIVWLMYWRRRIALARLVFAFAVLLLIASPILSPWSVVFAMQKGLSPDPESAESVTLTRDEECLPAILVNPPKTQEPENALPVVASTQLRPELWSGAHRRDTGAEAIGFETRALVGDVPEGGRLSIGRVQAAYVGAQGRTVMDLVPARYTAAWRRNPDGERTAVHFWLLPRKAYEHLRELPVSLHLDYSVTLLTESRTAELAADGDDHYVPGFGFCSAHYAAPIASIKVDCFKRGAQPALMTAALLGAAPHSDVPSGYPDYMPALLELFSGKRHVMTLNGVSPENSAHVKLTSFEPSAHFDRRVVSDGVLGGPPDKCPAPPPGS